MIDPHRIRRIVYLLGAGATHACVRAVNSAHGILMRDLGPALTNELRLVVRQPQYRNAADSLNALVNDVITDATDFEHIITFLDESSSSLHRQFADDLRKAFEKVLRERLRQIEIEQGGTPDGLLDALLDMHDVPNLGEELHGFLTLNYDGYLEKAIARLPDRRLDLGVNIEPGPALTDRVRVLKLHGSFDWKETWPITRGADGATLWIPPGIQKAKEHYPFNLLWGLARELLDCDVLRIVGCRLGANDWDLISLLFTTRHTNVTGATYRIELIDAPSEARRLQTAFPYLGVQSILEVEPIGRQLVAELSGGAPRAYETLSADEQKRIVEQAGSDKNWLRLWLKHKAEATFRELGSVSTDRAIFERLLETN